MNNKLIVGVKERERERGKERKRERARESWRDMTASFSIDSVLIYIQ